MTETGFKIISFQEFRELGVSTMKPKPKVVFVNRRKTFKQPIDTLARYLDFMRRYEYRGPKLQKQFSLEGSHYDERYRHKLLKNKDAVRSMRSLATISKQQAVYMVYDKPRPDAEIIVNICGIMMNDGVW